MSVRFFFRSLAPARFGVLLLAAGLYLLLTSWYPPGDSAQAQSDRPAEPPAQADPAEPQKRVGHYIRIPSPVTTETYARIRQVVTKMLHRAGQQGRRPVIVFEIHPGANQYGAVSDLAKFISGPALSGATTVAYVPQSLHGHAVLLALACDEIMMHEEAQIGDAGRDEPRIDSDVRSGYVLIAERKRTIAPDLALGLLDPAMEIWLVETNLGRDYVRKDRLPEVRQRVTVESEKVLIPAGEPGLFTAAEARDLGFVHYLARDLAGVARRLGLPSDALRADPSTYEEWRPFRVDVRGPITARLVQQVQRTIEQQTAPDGRDANFICVWLDSPGGSLADSLFLANYLAAMDPAQRRTVAYIPNEARGDALLVALGCDQIVMHPHAVLGGSGYGPAMSREDIGDAVSAVRALAKEKMRSWSLAAATIDPDLPVHRYVRKPDGLVQYFCEEELAEQKDPQSWDRGEAVTAPGAALELSGEEALQFALVSDVVDTFDEFKAAYGLEADPMLAEATWADQLIDALASPAVATFLLILGGAALYAELQMPGIGLGGLISAICFVLYFWAKFLGGTAGWLEVLLFGMGAVLLLIELFALPGFGIFGLTGGLLMIGSLVLASQTFVLPRNTYELSELSQSLLLIGVAGMGILGLGFVVHRYLPRTPVMQDMVLDPASEGPRPLRAETSYEHLVGTRGTAVTRLIPSGKARLHGQVLDVISEGEFIAEGAEVVVTQVRGTRIKVRAAD